MHEGMSCVPLQCADEKRDVLARASAIDLPQSHYSLLTSIEEIITSARLWERKNWC